MGKTVKIYIKIAGVDGLFVIPAIDLFGPSRAEDHGIPSDCGPHVQRTVSLMVQVQSIRLTCFTATYRV